MNRHASSVLYKKTEVSHFRLTLAPWAMSHSTKSRLSYLTATPKGVRFHSSGALTPAPRASQERTSSMWPPATAVMSRAGLGTGALFRHPPHRSSAATRTNPLRFIVVKPCQSCRRQDPESLRDAPRPGRPRAAAALTNERIAQEIRRDPVRPGYHRTGWTVSLLADPLRQKYGRAITVRTLRRRMHELGLRWKRPRYVHLTRDPHRAQKKGGWCARGSGCPSRPCRCSRMRPSCGGPPRCATRGPFAVSKPGSSHRRERQTSPVRGPQAADGPSTGRASVSTTTGRFGERDSAASARG
jgi:transposase